MSTNFKRRLQILLLVSLFSSAAYGIVPYNNEGEVNQVISDLGQVIIDNTTYELAPAATLHHSESNAPVIEQLEAGQSIGYLLLESDSEMLTEQITDIWLIE